MVLPVPKLAVPVNEPATSTLPAESTAMPLATVLPVPPRSVAQTRLPLLSSLTTKASPVELAVLCGVNV